MRKGLVSQAGDIVVKPSSNVLKIDGTEIYASPTQCNSAGLLIHNGCAHIQVKPNNGNLQLVAGSNAVSGVLNIDASSQNSKLLMRAGSANAFDFTVGSNSYMKVDSGNQRLILAGGNSVSEFI